MDRYIKRAKGAEKRTNNKVKHAPAKPRITYINMSATDGDNNPPGESNNTHNEIKIIKGQGVRYRRTGGASGGTFAKNYYPRDKDDRAQVLPWTAGPQRSGRKKCERHGWRQCDHCTSRWSVLLRHTPRQGTGIPGTE